MTDVVFTVVPQFCVTNVALTVAVPATPVVGVAVTVVPFEFGGTETGPLVYQEMVAPGGMLLKEYSTGAEQSCVEPVIVAPEPPPHEYEQVTIGLLPRITFNSHVVLVCENCRCFEL